MPRSTYLFHTFTLEITVRFNVLMITRDSIFVAAVGHCLTRMLSKFTGRNLMGCSQTCETDGSEYIAKDKNRNI